MSSYGYAGGFAPDAPLGPDATPQQLRDVIAAQPGRALEVAVHPAADEALRQWLWQSGDDELRLGMYHHYLFQREQLLAAWQPLPAQAIQFDAAVAQAQLLLESGRMPVAAGQAAASNGAAVGAPVSQETAAAGPANGRATLRLADGSTIALRADRVLLGRQPQAGSYPDAQLVPIPDPSRQLSSTHALLERTAGQWRLTDLHSTNGTVLGDAPHSPAASPGVAYVAPPRFVIGRQPVELVIA